MARPKIAILSLGLRGAAVSADNGNALLQSWSGMLDSSSEKSKDTPVTRVVGLLKNMAKEVKAEQDEDETLYRKLVCWCNDNDWEKGNAIESGEAKIDELKATIQSLTGSTAELRVSLKELEAEIGADKKALAEATAIREKQLEDFHNMEKDNIQYIENLKAAITVLAKHHDAPPDSTVAGGAVFKSEKDSWGSKSALWGGSLLETEAHGFPSSASRSFDEFLRANGMDGVASDPQVDGSDASIPSRAKFLQQKGGGSLNVESTWSSEDAAVVTRALKSASAFVQAKQKEGYYPAYTAQSGEIMGVLKQMHEEMEGDLSEAQKREQMRAVNFADLRAAKMQEIESGERSAEEKEDQLANQDNQLAEAKEDLGQEEATLSENQKFLKNVKQTCAAGNKNFEARKASRLQEMSAIAEAIDILTGDEARDAMSGTFSFVQVKESSTGEKVKRRQVANLLRNTAKASQDPQLSILATSAELDSFTRVKKAIDDMISMLKQQQEDEVKKGDYCKTELQSNEMATAKKQTQQGDLEAAIDKLSSDIKALEVGIADSMSQIAKEQTDLQTASKNRKSENQDFQKVIADQTVTIEVLHKALDKLATYYDLVQTESSKGPSWIQRQAPPVPEKEYSKNKGSTGVMEMIEKLVYDAKELMGNSKTSEGEAQAAYEQLIADTNDSVAGLQKEIVSKTQAKIDAEKDRRQAKSDLNDTLKELDGLAKYNAELHADCDYVLKNFDVRQQGRAEEIKALQEAKQILSGASLN